MQRKRETCEHVTVSKGYPTSRLTIGHDGWDNPFRNKPSSSERQCYQVSDFKLLKHTKVIGQSQILRERQTTWFLYTPKLIYRVKSNF